MDPVRQRTAGREGDAVKILFLDFDGVLNSHVFAIRVPNQGVLDLDPETVVLLQEIVDRTGCDIVVSSTWRKHMKRTQLCDVLRKHGFKGRIVVVTPEIPGALRGNEIQRWLDTAGVLRRFNVETFVILDDDSDMAHLKHQLVRTSFTHGLQREHVEAVVAMFGEVKP
jgi:methylmalonyl-CoA mutase cobalamin-binding subunit